MLNDASSERPCLEGCESACRTVDVTPPVVHVLLFFDDDAIRSKVESAFRHMRRHEAHIATVSSSAAACFAVGADRFDVVASDVHGLDVVAETARAPLRLVIDNVPADCPAVPSDWRLVTMGELSPARLQDEVSSRAAGNGRVQVGDAFVKGFGVRSVAWA